MYLKRFLIILLGIIYVNATSIMVFGGRDCTGPFISYTKDNCGCHVTGMKFRSIKIVEYTKNNWVDLGYIDNCNLNMQWKRFQGVGCSNLSPDGDESITRSSFGISC